MKIKRSLSSLLLWIALPAAATGFKTADTRQTATGFNTAAPQTGIAADTTTACPAATAWQPAEPLIVWKRGDRFTLEVGGYLNLRAGYDFGGISDDADFVPYLIPVRGATERQQLTMDATTSRLHATAAYATRRHGPIVLFLNMDLRGGAAGSYTPRIRSARLSFCGVTLGRDVTTFCDLDALPSTVDFRSPNAHNLDFATVIRYERSFARDRLTCGVALELPATDGNYGTGFAPAHQRMPDIPLYVQTAWGDGQRRSHLRLSTILRTMRVRDLGRARDRNLTGWGVQLSGQVHAARWLTLFSNGIYGDGVSKYLADLAGCGLDFTADPADPRRIRTTTAWGWQGATEFRVAQRTRLSGGYSTVRIVRGGERYADDCYRRGDYLFGNVIHNLTRRLSLGAEYLHGLREDMDGRQGRAHRVNIMAQFDF